MRYRVFQRLGRRKDSVRRRLGSIDNGLKLFAKEVLPVLKTWGKRDEASAAE